MYRGKMRQKDDLDRLPNKWDVFEADILTDLPRQGGQVDGRKKLMLSIIRVAKDDLRLPCRALAHGQGSQRWIGQVGVCARCDAEEFFREPQGERVINLQTVCEVMGLEVGYVKWLVATGQPKGYRHQVRR